MYEEKHERDTLFSVTEKYTELRLLNDAPSGFGWAVLVRDNFENDRLKVIKLPNREAATRELLVEAEILAKIAQYLRHPNLIQLGSVECYKITWNDREEKRWFIVLQFGGNNLRRHLGRLGLRSVEGRQEYVYRGGKPLSLDEFFDIGLQIVDGLKALHEFEEVPGQHIIHRDIKPENILIDDRGVVRLTDFGISKIVERISQSITVAGTPPYLPPEYALGRISAASDIYSTGIVLYEMVTGRFPFRSPEDKFYTMPTPPTDVNPQTPAALSDIIMQALYWNPNAPRGEQARDRYHTAADMMNDLRRCYGRLHPVPPQFERISNEPGQQTIYRNKGT
ncbi:MAG: serine/threonine protein kinase, partial [Planctomycetes bacterium]|nr:serine/threonine protein kinase [Planctomycetota bacterium]